jgi:hypothetical protein
MDHRLVRGRHRNLISEDLGASILLNVIFIVF